MARPTASEELNESTEYLKRRFIRQNRELARINAVQAIQLRNLEVEISRLLAENVELRERLIHFDRRSESPKETAEEHSPSNEESRTTKPERVAPDPCLETIEEEKSPVLSRVAPGNSLARRQINLDLDKSPVFSRSTSGVTLSRKPLRKPRIRDTPFSEPSVTERSVLSPLGPDSPSSNVPAQEQPKLDASVLLEAAVLEQPMPIPPDRKRSDQGQPVPDLPLQESPTREPLAPKTRRAARVSYVEPSLKKKMRRSDIFANAVKSG